MWKKRYTDVAIAEVRCPYQMKTIRPKNKFVPVRKREYAMYYGDRFICFGKIEELAERTGNSYDTMQWYTTKHALKRSVKNGTSIYLLRVDNLEEDEG